MKLILIKLHEMKIILFKSKEIESILIKLITSLDSFQEKLISVLKYFLTFKKSSQRETGVLFWLMYLT